MDISGSYTLNYPRERVWDALLDPDLLRRAVPGCQTLERVAEDTYHIGLSIGIAAVKGVYTGTLRLADLRPPDHLRMVVDGKGARGNLHGDGTLTLTAPSVDSTTITYTGQAQLNGPIAAVGNRLAGGAASMLIKMFFSRLGAALKEGEAAEQPEPMPEASAQP